MGKHFHFTLKCVLGVVSMLFMWQTQSHASPQKMGNHVLDSLKNSARSNPYDTLKLQALISLANYYQFTKLDSNQYYGYQALQFARQHHNYRGEVEAHNSLIGGFVRKYKIDSIWAHMHLSKQITLAHNDLDLLCSQLFLYGNVYEDLNKRDSSLYNFLEANKIAEKSHDHIIKATILHGISQFYIRQKDYDKALTYCLAAFDQRYGKDSLELTGLMSDLGNIYFWKKDYKTAEKYYLMSLEECKHKNVWWGYGYTLNNLGLVSSKLHEFQKAVDYFNESLKYYTIDHNTAGLANTSGNLAKLYFDNDEYDEALKYALNAAKEGEGLQDFKVLAENYGIISDIYEEKGDYRNALVNERKADTYKDSIRKAEEREKTTDLQIKFETSQKEVENLALKEKQAKQEQYGRRQNQLAILISVFLGLTLFIIYLMYRNSRQQKKLNEEISDQRNELEETNQFKSKLFSIISHDFRGPLTSLNGFLYLIQEDMLDKQELLVMSRSMLEQLNTTSAFLDNMLFWAQTQLKGYRAFIHPLNLHLAVMEIIDLYKNAAEGKNITLVNKIKPDEELEADANLIKLVLRNLVSNAIKFTDNGKIRISCERISGEMIVSVSDHGIGIPEEVQKRLFSGERHTTLGTKQEKGTGLGLVLCREFIEANGGRIWIQSSGPNGTTFCFSVPLQSAVNS